MLEKRCPGHSHRQQGKGQKKVAVYRGADVDTDRHRSMGKPCWDGSQRLIDWPVRRIRPDHSYKLLSRAEV
jgi:hypothetical protein